MKDQKNEPAFPLEQDYAEHTYHAGLTKREYFAAKAMQAYASSKSYDTYSYETIAQYSVKLADRVLEELDKK